ncbi:hypothetical protein [Natronomonas sp.]|uniref:hypothetical protein n=1 Tax=Natronomonas sp. TaxID=2184060 RepID=UPI002FC34E75
MFETEHIDAGTWMLVLFIAVVAFLIGVGLLQFAATGDYVSLLRRVGIGAILMAFGVGFYRKWQPA